MAPSPVVILIGDSDIARWPSHLWPTGTTLVAGRDGATLDDTAKALSSTLQQESSSATDTVVVVLCAGENDVGSGTPDHSIEATMREIGVTVQRQPVSCRAVFLGPKLEPWLVGDAKSRKDYAKMSRLLERCCDGYDVVFQGCLTMFCDNADVPGAIWGNKATPKAAYFDMDQLHLSPEGYGVWKRVVDKKVAEMLEDI